jgi:hypothetical protein
MDNTIESLLNVQRQNAKGGAGGFGMCDDVSDTGYVVQD